MEEETRKRKKKSEPEELKTALRQTAKPREAREEHARRSERGSKSADIGFYVKRERGKRARVKCQGSFEMPIMKTKAKNISLSKTDSERQALTQTDTRGEAEPVEEPEGQRDQSEHTHSTESDSAELPQEETEEEPKEEPTEGLEEEPMKFPDVTPLLDSKVLRSKLEVARSRSRARSPRSMRVTSSETQDWRSCDSLDGPSPASDSEFQEPPQKQQRPLSVGQRASLLPKVNPAALITLLLGRKNSKKPEGKKRNLEENHSEEEIHSHGRTGCRYPPSRQGKTQKNLREKRNLEENHSEEGIHSMDGQAVDVTKTKVIEFMFVEPESISRGKRLVWQEQDRPILEREVGRRSRHQWSGPRHWNSNI
ncbi:hypothetical protein WMY93_000099 [Mugilogobius chulae]|uniref:Tankyrase 1-binding protein C-terminal domain-containing protein n=1 Tax=Mugilogobius chulae TaxID=88201 RepID=A0AAW0PXY2_9GOBI